MDELARLTRNIVSIPSHEDETAAGDFIEHWLEAETAATVARDDHGNVIARRGAGPESLALVGHHDVVPPDDSQVDGDEYVVHRDGDRLYGRGTADMKGAVAAMLCAFRDADLAGQDGEGDSGRGGGVGVGPTVDQLVFVSYVGEEIGGVGARGAIEDSFVPDYAVVGEGSTDYSKDGVTDVAIAHRGRRAVTIEAEGRAAHASEPEAGANAIYRASDAVDVVRDLPVPATTVLGLDVEGSIAVTEIEGGSAWNVIPEACTVTVDERTVPDRRAELDELAELPGVGWTVDQDLPPMACRDDDFADAVAAVNRSVHAARADAGTPAEVVKPHATDAGWLSEAGTTCVVCGPAEPAQAHTADESVSIDVLERCYRLYRGVAEACTVVED